MTKSKTYSIVGLIISIIVLTAISWFLIQSGVSGLGEISSQVGIGAVVLFFIITGIWVYQNNVRGS